MNKTKSMLLTYILVYSLTMVAFLLISLNLNCLDQTGYECSMIQLLSKGSVVFLLGSILSDRVFVKLGF